MKVQNSLTKTASLYLMRFHSRHSKIVGRSINSTQEKSMHRAHHKLLAWQMSRKLVKEIYTITERFPASEQFGLSAQLRRAAVSIPSNIAEGAARTSHREFHRFLGIARGSLAEVETQLFLANDLGFYMDNSGLRGRIAELFAVINGLMKDIRRRFESD